jgi:hypothetical protein
MYCSEEQWIGPHFGPHFGPHLGLCFLKRIWSPCSNVLLNILSLKTHFCFLPFKSSNSNRRRVLTKHWQIFKVFLLLQDLFKLTPKSWLFLLRPLFCGQIHTNSIEIEIRRESLAQDEQTLKFKFQVFLCLNIFTTRNENLCSFTSGPLSKGEIERKKMDTVVQSFLDRDVFSAKTSEFCFAYKSGTDVMIFT